MATYHWHRYTASESFDRLLQGENPWVAFGDFLDDWRRSRPEDRFSLVEQPLKEVSHPEQQRWAALFAAAIEQLCIQERLTPPAWALTPRYYLSEPWYLGIKTENLRRLYEQTTPEVFKRHNVIGGEKLLSRV
jgi:hypothetical protein